MLAGGWMGQGKSPGPGQALGLPWDAAPPPALVLREPSALTLSRLSLRVSCSMVRKIAPTSLRASRGGERLGGL